MLLTQFNSMSYHLGDSEGNTIVPHASEFAPDNESNTL